jgi:chromosome segregation protein
MYLKSLELSGFKSFADKTRLEYHPGTTAIVGPNGCGKSNVLDAIRWVLGEQSAKALRGAEMADVIFSGTEGRRSLSLAEVSLTFTDCGNHLGTEFHEVTVTRRVFRDGTGEYELNGVKTRLRDILALFMDTGIGTDAYSIMEQGKIAKIISSKPEDRREIFEEAAGITKFKSQKREALRKLEQTEANLLRLSDIIKENQRRVNSLQRQAGKAKRYQELFHALRDKETVLARHEYGSLRERLVVLESDAAAVTAEVGGVAELLREGEAALAQARDLLDAASREVEESRRAKAEQSAALDQARSHLTFNAERLQNLEAADHAARAEITAAEARHAEASSQVGTLDADLQRAEADLARQRAQFEQDQSEHQAAAQRLRTMRDELQQRSTNLAQVEARISSLAQELAGWDLQKRTLLLRVESARADLSAHQKVIEGCVSEKSALVAVRASAEQALASARVEAQSAADAARTAREQLESARREREVADRERVQLASQRDTLLRLEQAGEGLSAVTRSVLEAAGAGALPGVPSVRMLADLMDVRDGWAPAVERLLGWRLQALVVEDASAAGAVLDFLGGRDTDRVAVAAERFPSITWHGERRAESLLHHISARPGAERVVEALFGNVLVAASREAAFALKAEVPHACIVCPDGLVLSAEGLIETGREGGAGALLSRRGEIAVLDGRVTDAAGRVESLAAAERGAAEAAAAADSRLEQARGALREREAELSTSGRELALVERQEAETRNRLRQAESELARIDESGRVNEKREAEQFAQREALVMERAGAEREVERVKAALAEAQEREAAVSVRVNDLRVALASGEERRNGLAAQLAPLRARIEELARAAESRRAELVSNESRRAAVLREDESLARKVEELTRDLAGADERITALQARRDEAASGIESREVALRGTRERAASLQDRRATCEIELNRARMEADNLAERMLRQYQVQADQLLLPFDTGVSYDWDVLRVEVAEMRQRLDAMGSVNLEAITEYEELEQRLGFLTAQEKDALDGKASILEAITRINHTTQKLFAETFEAIRVNFQTTFTELFGGGRANLTLSDEADPLESGIDIVAKPPGKELKSITLLSGGEQTMTAVSLLFAIYMVKPSPFCVLDEMDAPLDESNINRFLKMLDRFKGQSQFVLITHNKRTISFADAIYGVTMPEQGVSRVASVRFTAVEDRKRDEGIAPSVSESMGKPLDGPSVALPG